MDDMVERFRALWDVLSKPGVSENRIQLLLTDRRVPELPAKLSQKLNRYPGTKNRNIYQVELKIVSEHVLEDISRNPNLEGEFLRNCYCSSGALSQHSLLSKQVLDARYAAMFESGSSIATVASEATGAALSSEMTATSLSNRPILLLGDVGAGKTTFLRHFIAIDAADTVEKAICIYLDLGVRGTFIQDLREFVLDQLVRELRESHDIDVFERQFVRGVWNLELRRFAKSIYADLKESDPARFREKELEHLESLLEDRRTHLQKSLAHLERGRMRQVIVFLDNIDQREAALQQQAFLIAQELAAVWKIAVFLTLRPETFHKSQRDGVLSGYHPKTFTISPPRTDRLLQRRLKFAQKITSGDISIESLAASAGTTLNELDLVLGVLQNSLSNNRQLVECIDNLASGNMRMALDLVRGFLGSGHVDTEKIARIQREEGSYTVPVHEFLRATLYGDGVYYDPSASPIANVFDIANPDPKEHFLVLGVLSILNESQAGMEDFGFCPAARVYERLQGCGFTPEQIDGAINRVLRSRLAHTAEREAVVGADSVDLRLRLASLGAYHLKRLAGAFVYLDAVVVDTPILDSDGRETIGDEGTITARLRRSELFLDYLNSAWQAFGESTPSVAWPDCDRNAREEIERIRSRA